MIPKLSDILVKESRIKSQQKYKDHWRNNRNKALLYYSGNTDKYTGKYFSENTLNKIPISNINITKRIIDRVSMVYMKEPIREVSNDHYFEYIKGKNEKMQRAEKMTNLLELILIKPTWRNGKVEYDLIFDFEPIFGDDPLSPIGICYPLSVRSQVKDTTPELWAYWDLENHFVYDNNSEKIIKNDMNPDMINPYGMLPFAYSFRDGIPENEFLGVNASDDLVQTNEMINVVETTKTANIVFQSFGYVYVSGEMDNKRLEVGPDKITMLELDSSMGVVSPPNTIQSIDESIKTNYRMLAQNYHLTAGFVEGTTAESGIAHKLRNQELMEARKSDVERWRNIEKHLFDIEKEILRVDAGIDIGILDGVDFSESVNYLTEDEQQKRDDWDLSKGLIDKADILVRRNPDWTREDAQQYLVDRRKTEVTIKKESDTQENIFKLGRQDTQISG